MFNVGPAELLVILVVALLVLGPTKLPDAARQLGKAMAEFRRMTSGLQDEVRGVMNEHFDPEPPPPAISPPPAVVETAKDSAESNGKPPAPAPPPFTLE